MTRLFLILLLITKHSFVACMDDTAELFEAISYQADFSRLTPAQKTMYTPKINLKNDYGITPVEWAALWGNTSAMDWLVSNNVTLNDTKALEWSLQKAPDKCVKAKIVSSLLTHGASTDIVIDTKKPLDFMQDKLINKQTYYNNTGNVVSEMQHVASVLRRYDDPLLWTWIKAAALIDSGRVEVIETKMAKRAKTGELE